MLADEARWIQHRGCRGAVRRQIKGKRHLLSLISYAKPCPPPQTPGPEGRSCAREPQRSTAQPIPSLCWIEGMRQTSSKGDGSTLPGTAGNVCENLLTKGHVEGKSRAESGQMHLPEHPHCTLMIFFLLPFSKTSSQVRCWHCVIIYEATDGRNV